MADTIGYAIELGLQQVKTITESEVKIEENVSNGEPPSTLEKKLIRQIEFYFGDVNLPRDKFLLEQVKLNDGWVPLETMFKFKRLASFSTDADTVIAALLKSREQLMEVSEDGTKIRRSLSKPQPIMNKERKKEMSVRTLYIEGFPLKDITLDNVLEYFAQYDHVEHIHMQSYQYRGQSIFKGSVFALFKTVDEAKKFIELESVKYQDKVLVRKWQVDYYEYKCKEREEKLAKRKARDSIKLPRGCVLHFKGLAEKNEITQEMIKSQLEKLGADVAYIYFNRGDTELWVRFYKENSAKNVMAEHIWASPYTLCECDVEVRLLEGEEEDKFLAKTKEDIAQKNQARHCGNQRGQGRYGDKFRWSRWSSRSEETGQPRQI